MRRSGFAAVALIGVAVAGVATVGGVMGRLDSSSAVDGAEIVDFDPGYVATEQIRVMGRNPVAPGDGVRPRGRPPQPAQVFVAVTGATGCRQPTGAELHRDGERLFVRFTGGEDHEECYRPYSPFVQFTVDRSALRGVATLEDTPVTP
jgi:hypothetical protein